MFPRSSNSIDIVYFIPTLVADGCDEHPPPASGDAVDYAEQGPEYDGDPPKEYNCNNADMVAEAVRSGIGNRDSALSANGHRGGRAW